MAAGSRIRGALASFAGRNEILGFKLKIGKTQRGARPDFLGETARFAIFGGVCRAHWSPPPDRIRKLAGGISRILQRKVVALRPLYRPGTRGGGELDKRAKWALRRRIQLPPNIAPRIMQSIGTAVDVRLFWGAWCADGGLAAVACFSNHGDEFLVLLKSAAERGLIESLKRNIWDFRVGAVCGGSRRHDIRPTAGEKGGCPVFG